MSLNAPAQWIVTYDIREPRRLGRVHRYLKKKGLPIQYSVFLVPASDLEMNSLVGGLKKLIDDRCDDVRAYKLPERSDHVMLGHSLLPEGVWFSDQAHSLLNHQSK
jgi:CRISPR-associated protein Cas2